VIDVFAVVRPACWRRLFFIPVRDGAPDRRADLRAFWLVHVLAVVAALVGVLPGLVLAAVRSGGLVPVVRALLSGDPSVLPALFWLGGVAAACVPVYFWVEAYANAFSSVLSPRLSRAAAVCLGAVSGVGAVVLPGVFMRGVVSALGPRAARLLSPPLSNRLVAGIATAGLSAVEFALLCFVLCVAVPLIEEHLFRRMLYANLRGALCRQGLGRGLSPRAASRRAVWLAAVWSALVFALLHLPAPLYFPVYMFIGLLLAFVYERAGRLSAPVVAHAVVYYRIVDPALTLVNVENFHQATAELAQTTLRSVVGQAELDQLLTDRERLNLQLQKILDEATDRWGIKVTAVEIKDVVIPEGLLAAIARQAEAERQRRALVIHADAERQAAERLAEAAKTLTAAPGGLTLRVLRTLPDIAARPGSVVAFPVPIELATLLGRAADGGRPAELDRPRLPRENALPS